MDFSLSDEQRMFLGLFEDFSANEVAKHAEETDRSERPPLELLRKAAAQGFLGAIVPEQYGGAGLDCLTYTLLLQTLARHCLSTALTVAAHTSLATLSVLLGGDEAQKERFLPGLASGETLGAFMLTEPEAGNDYRALSTTAVRDDGHYTLDGLKTWVSNGQIAGLFVAIAAAGKGAASAFVLEKDTPGLSVGYREPTLGLRGQTFNTVYLEDAEVPAENRLGADGAAWELVPRLHDHWRVAIAAAALGAAEGALAMGVEYAAGRKQFGAAIAQKGAIQAFVAESVADIESARHLVHHAAWLCDTGQPFAREASLARYKGAWAAKEAANRMLQIHGGYGFSDEYAISRFHRDARALRMLGGADEVQRILIAAPEFARRGVTIQL